MKFNKGDKVRIKEMAFKGKFSKDLYRWRGATVEVSCEGNDGIYWVKLPAGEIWIKPDEIELIEPAPVISEPDEEPDWMNAQLLVGSQPETPPAVDAAPDAPAITVSLSDAYQINVALIAQINRLNERIDDPDEPTDKDNLVRLVRETEAVLNRLEAQLP